MGARRTTLCVIRHGHAGDSSWDPRKDEARALTGKGRAQARRAGEALAALALSPVAVWTSPLRRAVETADAALAAAGSAAPRVVTDAIHPDAPPGRVLAELAGAGPLEGAAGAGPGPAVGWLVGHEPHLSAFVALCVEDLPDELRIAKGDVLVLESERGVAQGAFRLVHRLTAATLEARGA